MAQAKLLLLIVNLVFIRLAFASSAASSLSDTADHSQVTAANSTAQDSTASLFDNLNSLDFAPNKEYLEESNLHQHEDLKLAEKKSHLSNGKRKGKSSGSSSRASKSQVKSPLSNNNVGQLVLNILSQLERMDMKRMISDSFLSTVFNSQQTGSARARSNEQVTTQNSNQTNNNISSQSSPRAAGPLTAEAGNLLSITKQLVKLARSQMGSDLSSSGSWWSPSSALLSSHGAHGLGDPFAHDFTAAGFKSDWFWLAVPAVIVVGAGVIVIPLIAAWLVSQAMSQNTFTVSAGRRRRRRRRDTTSGHSQAARLDSSHLMHAPDLFKLINVYQLIDDPHLLADKLSKFHSALDSIGSSFIGSTLKAYKDN